MTPKTQVGFSQRIQLDWLERTATLALAGNPKQEIQAELQELLRDQLSVGSEARGSNRDKAVSILLNVWVSVPDELRAFRDDGLEFLRRLPVVDHKAVHWGMTMAAYPFFGMVAQTVGRLLELQGHVVAAQAQRRIKEQLGERETVARAARRVLRCFVDWGVLHETAERGAYQAVPVRPVKDKMLAAWLVEAVLIASGSKIGALNRLSRAPALFPFTISPLNSTVTEANTRLEFFRQGFDEEMVILRTAPFL